MSFALSEVDTPKEDTFSPKKISLIESEFPNDLKETVMEITSYKCSTCHVKNPSWEGMLKPPKGVYFHEFKDLVNNYRGIYKQVAASHAILGNITFLEEEERLVYAKFYHKVQEILEKN